MPSMQRSLPSSQATPAPRFRRPWRRIVAWWLCLAFLFPYAAFAFEPATYPPQTADAEGLMRVSVQGAEIAVPQENARITSAYQGTTNLTVVYVQDLHCNYEVQSNIVAVLDRLVKDHHLRLVGVEGDSTPIDVGKLASIPEKTIRDDVGQYFLQRGRITGAEYCAAVKTGGLTLQGIEDQNLYDANKNSLLKFLNEESQGYCLDLHDALENLKRPIYSLDLAKLDHQRQALDYEHITLETYCDFLIQEARSRGLELGSYPVLSLYQLEKRLPLTPEADYDKLLGDAERLELALREKMYTAPEQGELDRHLRRLRIIENMVNISALEKDLEYYRGHKEEFRLGPMLRFVEVQSFRHALQPDLDPDVVKLEEYVRDAERFYELADQRSQAFVNNLLFWMKRNRQTMGVMITGGFHSARVEAALQARGVGYVAVKPRLTRTDAPNPYFSLLRDRKTPLEELLAKNQNIFAPSTGFKNSVLRQYMETVKEIQAAAFFQGPKTRAEMEKFRAADTQDDPNITLETLAFTGLTNDKLIGEFQGTDWMVIVRKNAVHSEYTPDLPGEPLARGEMMYELLTRETFEKNRSAILGGADLRRAAPVSLSRFFAQSFGLTAPMAVSVGALSLVLRAPGGMPGAGFGAFGGEILDTLKREVRPFVRDSGLASVYRVWGRFQTSYFSKNPLTIRSVWAMAGALFAGGVIAPLFLPAAAAVPLPSVALFSMGVAAGALAIRFVSHRLAGWQEQFYRATPQTKERVLATMAALVGGIYLSTLIALPLGAVVTFAVVTGWFFFSFPYTQRSPSADIGSGWQVVAMASSIIGMLLMLTACAATYQSANPETLQTFIVSKNLGALAFFSGFRMMAAWLPGIRIPVIDGIRVQTAARAAQTRGRMPTGWNAESAQTVLTRADSPYARAGWPGQKNVPSWDAVEEQSITWEQAMRGAEAGVIVSDGNELRFAQGKTAGDIPKSSAGGAAAASATRGRVFLTWDSRHAQELLENKSSAFSRDQWTAPTNVPLWDSIYGDLLTWEQAIRGAEAGVIVSDGKTLKFAQGKRAEDIPAPTVAQGMPSETSEDQVQQTAKSEAVRADAGKTAQTPAAGAASVEKETTPLNTGDANDNLGREFEAVDLELYHAKIEREKHAKARHAWTVEVQRLEQDIQGLKQRRNDQADMSPEIAGMDAHLSRLEQEVEQAKQNERQANLNVLNAEARIEWAEARLNELENVLDRGAREGTGTPKRLDTKAPKERPVTSPAEETASEPWARDYAGMDAKALQKEASRLLKSTEPDARPRLLRLVTIAAQKEPSVVSAIVLGVSKVLAEKEFTLDELGQLETLLRQLTQHDEFIRGSFFRIRRQMEALMVRQSVEANLEARPSRDQDAAKKILLEYYHASPANLDRELADVLPDGRDREQLISSFVRLKAENEKRIEKASFELNAAEKATEDREFPLAPVIRTLLNQHGLLQAWLDQPYLEVRMRLIEPILGQYIAEQQATGKAADTLRARLRLAAASVYFQDRFDIELNVPLSMEEAAPLDVLDKNAEIIAENQLPELIRPLEIIARELEALPSIFASGNPQLRRLIVLNKRREHYHPRPYDFGKMHILMTLDRGTRGELETNIAKILKTFYHELGHSIGGSYFGIPSRFSHERLLRWQETLQGYQELVPQIRKLVEKRSRDAGDIAANRLDGKKLYDIMHVLFTHERARYEDAVQQVINDLSSMDLDDIIETIHVQDLAKEFEAFPDDTWNQLPLEDREALISSIGNDREDPYYFQHDLWEHIKKSNPSLAGTILGKWYAQSILAEMEKYIQATAAVRMGDPQNTTRTPPPSWEYMFRVPRGDPTEGDHPYRREEANEFMAEMIRTYEQNSDFLRRQYVDLYNFLDLILGDPWKPSDESALAERGEATQAGDILKTAPASLVSLLMQIGQRQGWSWVSRLGEPWVKRLGLAGGMLEALALGAYVMLVPMASMSAIGLGAWGLLIVAHIPLMIWAGQSGRTLWTNFAKQAGILLGYGVPAVIGLPELIPSAMLVHVGYDYYSIFRGDEDLINQAVTWAHGYLGYDLISQDGARLRGDTGFRNDVSTVLRLADIWDRGGNNELKNYVTSPERLALAALVYHQGRDLSVSGDPESRLKNWVEEAAAMEYLAEEILQGVKLEVLNPEFKGRPAWLARVIRAVESGETIVRLDQIEEAQDGLGLERGLSQHITVKQIRAMRRLIQRHDLLVVADGEKMMPARHFRLTDEKQNAIFRDHIGLAKDMGAHYVNARDRALDEETRVFAETAHVSVDVPSDDTLRAEQAAVSARREAYRQVLGRWFRLNAINLLLLGASLVAQWLWGMDAGIAPLVVLGTRELNTTSNRFTLKSLYVSMDKIAKNDAWTNYVQRELLSSPLAASSIQLDSTEMQALIANVKEFMNAPKQEYIGAIAKILVNNNPGRVTAELIRGLKIYALLYASEHTSMDFTRVVKGEYGLFIAGSLARIGEASVDSDIDYFMVYENDDDARIITQTIRDMELVLERLGYRSQVEFKYHSISELPLWKKTLAKGNLGGRSEVIGSRPLVGGRGVFEAMKKFTDDLRNEPGLAADLSSAFDEFLKEGYRHAQPKTMLRVFLMLIQLTALKYGTHGYSLEEMLDTLVKHRKINSAQRHSLMESFERQVKARLLDGLKLSEEDQYWRRREAVQSAPLLRDLRAELIRSPEEDLAAVLFAQRGEDRERSIGRRYPSKRDAMANLLRAMESTAAKTPEASDEDIKRWAAYLKANLSANEQNQLLEELRTGPAASPQSGWVRMALLVSTGVVATLMLAFPWLVSTGAQAAVAVLHGAQAADLPSLAARPDLLGWASAFGVGGIIAARGSRKPKALATLPGFEEFKNDAVKMLEANSDVTIGYGQADYYSLIENLYGGKIADFIVGQYLQHLNELIKTHAEGSRTHQVYRGEERGTFHILFDAVTDEAQIIRLLHLAKLQLLDTMGKNRILILMHENELGETKKTKQASQFQNIIANFGVLAEETAEGDVICVVDEHAEKDFLNNIKRARLNYRAVPYLQIGTDTFLRGFLWEPTTSIGVAKRTTETNRAFTNAETEMWDMLKRAEIQVKKSLLRVGGRVEAYTEKAEDRVAMISPESAFDYYQTLGEPYFVPQEGPISFKERQHFRDAALSLLRHQRLVVQRWFFLAVSSLLDDATYNEALKEIDLLIEHRESDIANIPVDRLVAALKVVFAKLREKPSQLGIDVSEKLGRLFTTLYTHERETAAIQDANVRLRVALLKAIIEPEKREKELVKLHSFLRAILRNYSGAYILHGNVKKAYSLYEKMQIRDIDIENREAVAAETKDIVRTTIGVDHVKNISELVNTVVAGMRQKGFIIRDVEGVGAEVTQNQEGRYTVEIPDTRMYTDVKVQVERNDGEFPFGAEIKFLVEDQGRIENTTTLLEYAVSKMGELREHYNLIALGGPGLADKRKIGLELGRTYGKRVVDISLLYRGLAYLAPEKGRGREQTMGKFLREVELERYTDGQDFHEGDQIIDVMANRDLENVVRDWNSKPKLKAMIDGYLEPLIKRFASSGKAVILGIRPWEMIKADVNIYFEISDADRERMGLQDGWEERLAANTITISPKEQKNHASVMRAIRIQLARDLLENEYPDLTLLQPLVFAHALALGVAVTGLLTAFAGVGLLPAGIGLAYVSDKLVTTVRILHRKYGWAGMWRHLLEPVAVYNVTKNRVEDPLTGEAVGEASLPVVAHEWFAHRWVRSWLRGTVLDRGRWSRGSMADRLAYAVQEVLAHLVHGAAVPVAIWQMSGKKFWTTAGIATGFVLSGGLVVAGFFVALPIASALPVAGMLLTGSLMAMIRMPLPRASGTAAEASSEERARSFRQRVEDSVMSEIQRENDLGIEAQSKTSISRFLLRLGPAIKNLLTPSSLKLLLVNDLPGLGRSLRVSLLSSFWTGLAALNGGIVMLQSAMIAALQLLTRLMPARAFAADLAVRDGIVRRSILNILDPMKTQPRLMEGIASDLVRSMKLISASTRLEEILEVLNSLKNYRLDSEEVSFQRNGEKSTQDIPSVILRHPSLFQIFEEKIGPLYLPDGEKYPSPGRQRLNIDSAA